MEMRRSVNFGEAAAVLRECDPVLRDIIDRLGPYELDLEGNAFRALAESILYQQLTTKAADTITRRFTELYPHRAFPTPEDVLSTSDETLRQTGISNQKVRYLKDLAARCLDGTLTPSDYATMSDEEIIEQLCKVKGIGRWTAEMFLIFSLGRPNVLPVDDFGVRKAVQPAYGLAELPTRAQLRELGAKWEPHCTAATWYLWRSLRPNP